MLEDIPLQNIWNLDETALQHRTISSCSYVTINSDGHGVKCSKEHITVTPIVGATGEELILQVIRKSKQHCVLKGIDIDKKCQIKYDFQSKAWHDSSSMLRLFHRIAGVVQSHKATFYLLLDNCSSHVWAVKILPPEGLQEANLRLPIWSLCFSH